MAAFAKINNVAAADIAKVNNVAKAAIANVSGSTTPASGATLWTLVSADGGVGTAAASNLNAWTCYVSADQGSNDFNSIAYGKDGSGNGLWVAVNDDDDREIRYTSDPTAGVDAWSDIDPEDTNNNPLLGVAWGNNVWIAVGHNGELWRSTAGTTGWSLVDLSGVTGWVNDKKIWEVVSDGAGNWMFGQEMNVFLSTNDGAAWSRVVDFSASPTSMSGFAVYSMAYTASRWSVFLRKTGQSRAFHAASDATGTWAAATVDSVTQSGQTLVSHNARRMAAGDGTVIIVNANDVSRSTDGGQDWTILSNVLPKIDVRDVATDGNGNWIAVHDNGRVSISTDDGENWAEQSGNNASTGDRERMSFPTGGTNIENLDAIAADVFLPL